MEAMLIDSEEERHPGRWHWPQPFGPTGVAVEISVFRRLG
jgi:hypothetical protein